MLGTYIFIAINYTVAILLILFSGEGLLIAIGIFLLFEGVVVYIVGKRKFDKDKKESGEG